MIPSTKGKKNNIGTQTSVMPNGSSWVICDSKSRPGFKYYFNTESGEAVWNLSNKDQIEKAKKHTHLLHSKLGIVPELPEPQDQPPMNTRKNFKLPMSNFPSTGARNFNGNVWTIPPGVVQQPQIVLVPTVAPMLNTSIGNPNVHPTLALQNTLPFTYQNFGNYNVPYNNTNSGKVPFNNSNYRGTTSYKNKQFQRYQGQNSIGHRRGSEDLRQKLARNRSVSESNLPHLLPYTQGYLNSDFNDSEHNSSPNEICKSEFPGFQATEEIENESNKDTFQLDDCYVVVDKDIILSEFVFLDNLVSNNPSFRLVVPHHVMSELKTHACKNGEARVRRIVRFLSQKIESRLVYLGEEIEENSLQNWDKTFITCEKLAENYDNNVILVSKINETRKFRGNNNKIKVMSMCQFKDMLSNTKAIFPSPTRAIKIIIPNNLKIDEKPKTNANDGIREETDESKLTNGERKATNVEIKATNIERKATNTEGNITNVERKATNAEGNVTNVERKVAYVEKKDSSQSILSPSSKQTVDTAVQTEIDTEVNKVHCIFSDTNIEDDTTISHKNTTKKREIRLNRTTPMKKARIEQTSSDKKQFKWRKNRATTNNSNNSKRTQSTSNVSTETTTIRNVDTDIIPNVTVTESKQKKNSSPTFTENSFAVPKTNSVIDREQVKTTPSVAEKDTNTEICRKTSTESWIESLPNSKSDTDKDSKNSSHRIVNKTNTNTSTVANNVNSVVHKVPVKPVNKNIVLKNVEMITITGPSMEEVLRIRSDEWVSRFVQIMEEVLKEKLQENPPFENDEYPPPWNLYEAAKCIIKKYSNYFNVVNAANKLSFILYKISDEKEKIPLTLQPSEFMEMYSYGVYLVETLQDVSNNCDELHAAKESLKTLLYDIQNANTDNSCTDIFGDGLHESYGDYRGTISTDITESNLRPGQEQSTPKKTTQNRCTKRSNANKKLEADKTTSEAPEVSQSKSSSIDKKASFLSNLKLVTRSTSSPSTITSPAYSNLTVRSPVNSSVKSPLPVATKLLDNKHENDTSKNEESFKNNEEIVSSSGQPNFVRSFQICPEFEARINKARSLLEFNDSDESYSDDDHCDDDDGFHFNMSQSKNCVPKDNTVKDVPVFFVNNPNKNEFNKFGLTFGDPQLRYIKEIFADVIDHLSVTTKESKNLAIKIYPCIEKIHNSLDTILKKNVHYSDANIKEFPKNVNGDSMVEEIFCLQYRNTITQFRDQAHIIIKYLKLVLSTS